MDTPGGHLVGRFFSNRGLSVCSSLFPMLLVFQCITTSVLDEQSVVQVYIQSS